MDGCGCCFLDVWPDFDASYSHFWRQIFRARQRLKSDQNCFTTAGTCGIYLWFWKALETISRKKTFPPTPNSPEYLEGRWVFIDLLIFLGGGAVCCRILIGGKHLKNLISTSFTLFCSKRPSPIRHQPDFNKFSETLTCSVKCKPHRSPGAGIWNLPVRKSFCQGKWDPGWKCYLPVG